MSKTQPTPKQKEYWDRMRATGGWQKIGSKGGKRNVELAGTEGMAERGQRGGLGLIDKLGGMERARAHFSTIGKLKTRKDTTND
jgi:hypothetical protein